ncbi:MAG: ATP-binding cassette domain-containing protein, partial [Leptospirales bacterium]|nr:ATP-binding cassette domain-containing protein [Leptospirales bacterium]
MIEFARVFKKFGNKVVLNNVSFNINKGETFVIIGLSGAGKTTILRHIAGFIDPDSGTILIDDIRMNNSKHKVKAGLRKRMGFLFQSGALINWLTIRDNVALSLTEHKAGTVDEINRIVDEKLELLQLGDAGDKMPSEISGGMKKRAGLARAIVNNPDIILYDEPTSGLDPVMSSMISELIIQMQQKLGATSVVVTHDIGSAYHIADRIAMLYNGEILECGTPDEIRGSTDPIVKQFINGEIIGPIIDGQKNYYI